jgi:molybdopterin converting factor small subunit
VAAGTLVEVLESLEAAAPGIKARIVDDAGALRRFVNIFVGEEDVRFLDGINTVIADGATVSVIPAVAGG